MSDYVIGIDPDSNKHGVATYKDGKLERLDSMPLMELLNYVSNIQKIQEFGESIEFHMEDVKANKAVWHGRKESKSSFGMTSQKVAKCKQAQIEVERMIDFVFGLDALTLHKVSSKWKSQEGKKQFEKVTGWSGRSNGDTRSAAYFGFLGL